MGFAPAGSREGIFDKLHRPTWHRGVAYSHVAGLVIHQRVDYGMPRTSALSATRGGLRPCSRAPWFTGGWITGLVARERCLRTRGGLHLHSWASWFTGGWITGHVTWAVTGILVRRGFWSGGPKSPECGQINRSGPGILVRALKSSSSCVCQHPACFSALHVHQTLQAYLLH